jgi:ankyrin repeat protein
MLESFINSKDFNINLKNKKGYTPLDIALLNGFYISSEILINNGAQFCQDPIGILMTLITNGHRKTAELLIKNKLVYVSEELADSAPRNIDQMWLKNKVGISVPVEIAISKGLLEVVTEKLDSITETISWKPFLQIFNKPNSDQIKVIELLLKNKKIDPNEIIEVDVLNNEGILEKEITWPLFCCCEKGNLDLFQILINYVDLEKYKINMQNLKGTTCLWIACCNNKGSRP